MNKYTAKNIAMKIMSEAVERIVSDMFNHRLMQASFELPEQKEFTDAEIAFRKLLTPEQDNAYLSMTNNQRANLDLAEAEAYYRAGFYDRSSLGGLS